MSTLKFAFLVFQFCAVTSNALETSVIQTASGKVQGTVEGTALPDKYVQKFINIPYGEAPVGNLRLAKPEPKKPWTGIHKNSNESITCWHLSYAQNVKMTEDCLVLNIWTPYPQKANRSVMIWMHGGAFQYGYGNLYQGHNVVAIGDVILVTINYRLSVLGFFATGDDRVKGNFGLFDQRLAMKWVKENIVNFGGDPESITIFGQSAGAVSVTAHSLSNQSWPYFNRAILQSGSINAVWAISSQEQVKILMNQFLDSVNCMDNAEVLECLRNNVTNDDLMRIFITDPLQFDSTTSPLHVDGDFFTDDPKVLLKNGAFKKTPVLLGVTKDEGFYGFPAQLLAKTRDINAIKQMFEAFFLSFFKSSANKDVLEEARELYTSKCTPSTVVDAIRPIVRISSDHVFICSLVNEATTRTQLSPSTSIYLFRYSYATPVFILQNSYPQGMFGFVAHSAEVTPMLGVPVNNRHYPAEDQVNSMRIILYWTNFAKHGDPNVGITKLPMTLNKVDSLPNWPKYTNSSREYLDMESLMRMTVRNRLREKHCEFLSDPAAYVKKNGATASTTTPSSLAVKSIARTELLVAVLLLPLVFA